ncbi:MAG: enoyl-CoA hydratase-related protein [Thiofilum sp.]|uniref:enoyl-CoA hydratase/isomerase family protein n=1 Tax=Thiofilum sp. TaxID=2212733 RepID=UPI0025D42BE2|nr:enoyl-CoA hydratase-related protein [Thiofilum sp.]MBK8453689.1 enoyl-CoA hydratase/isomerase family protein [Thiofilum sp.]
MEIVVKPHLHENILTLTLSRPAFLNALTLDMARQLKAELLQAQDNEQVRCIVIKGDAGHFMAGGDLVYFASTLTMPEDERHQTGLEAIALVHETITLIRSIRKPVLASAQGAVAGFGVSLLAACDLAIAGADLKLTSAYCQMGLSPDGGFTYFLPRMIGEKRAKAVTLLNDVYNAEQALQMGLVNQVVPVEQLPENTLLLAQRLAQVPQHALAQAKGLINQSSGHSLEQQLTAEQQSFAGCMLTPDFAQRVTAFVNKRKAS